MDGLEWPVVNGHLYKSDGSIDAEAELSRRDFVGKAQNPVTKGGYLYVPNTAIEIPEEEWKGTEFSTVYSAQHEKLEKPYKWIDTEGKVGSPGEEYLIEEHHRDIRPVNLALVEKGRFGNNVAVREPNNKYLVANSAVEFKEKPMATAPAALKGKPTFPPDPNKKKEEIVTANNTEETTTTATPDPALTTTDQAGLIQTIITEIFKEDGAAAKFFAEQAAQVQAVVANAKTEIEQLVANAAPNAEPAKEEAAAPVEEKPLTAELIANSVEEAFKKCLDRANLATPHTPVTNGAEKQPSFAEMIAANNKN